MKLTEEQILHLIDLLEMNIKEKQSIGDSRFMTRDMIDEAITFDKTLLEILENEVREL